MRCCESGTRSLGLTMNVLPHAMAWGRNHMGTIAGKVEARDRREHAQRLPIVKQSMPVAMSSSERPCMVVGIPIAMSMLSIARRMLLRDSSSVLPCSIVHVRARSSNDFLEQLLHL